MPQPFTGNSRSVHVCGGEVGVPLAGHQPVSRQTGRPGPGAWGAESEKHRTKGGPWPPGPAAGPFLPEK